MIVSIIKLLLKLLLKLIKLILIINWNQQKYFMDK